MDKIKEFIKSKYIKITKKDKWKLYLYLNNVCIKKMYIDEEFAPMNQIYVLNVYFKKFLLGSNMIKTIVRSTKLKYTDNEKKEVHIEVKIFEGVDVQ